MKLSAKKLFASFALAAILGVAFATPAHADWDDHGRGWRGHREWHEHGHYWRRGDDDWHARVVVRPPAYIVAPAWRTVYVQPNPIYVMPPAPPFGFFAFGFR
ncbi:MAG: hypothetical protein KGI97_00660 [Alphaproteobacteria bacterium]|nr:hypothetical protein [Alphaproteobacteria bacterium]